jgi:hypothetical protein
MDVELCEAVHCSMQVPCAWQEDPRWRGPSGGGNRRQAAHRAEWPSRWLPARRRQQQAALHSGKGEGSEGELGEGEVHVIDHLVVPRERSWAK